MLQKVNLQSAVDADPRLYVYNRVGRLNGHVLSVVNVENRTLDFHVHEASAEYCQVVFKKTNHHSSIMQLSAATHEFCQYALKFC